MTTKTVARTQRQLTANALQQLAIIGGQMTRDDDIMFDGTKFVFPEQYRGDLRGLAQRVAQYVEGQEEMIKVSRTFSYLYLDGAHATYQCLKQFFGYAQSVPEKTFFGNHPPNELTVDTGFVDGELQHATVPWGNIILPALRDAYLKTEVNHTDHGQLFKLTATCHRSDKAYVDGFFEVVAKYLAANSIYRGHAITGGMEYIDTDAIDPTQFVYTEDTWAQVQTNILSPLRDTEVIRRKGLSLKRVVLLEGPFGSGKSGLGRTAAKIAVANNKTAIIARPGQDDPFGVLQTAFLYQPAMVFIEDVDTFSDSMDPTYVSRLLDVFDGFTAKDIEMTLVLTTNHAERIHKGMLRPGRLDAVIHIGEMDRPGVEQLCRIVVGDELASDVDYDAVFEATHGFMPAYVKEAIERAVRYTIARTGDTGQITTADLVHTCHSLRAQHALQEAAADQHETLPPLDQMFRRIVDDQMVSLDSISDVIDNRIESRIDGAILIDDDGEQTHHIATR